MWLLKSKTLWNHDLKYSYSVTTTLFSSKEGKKKKRGWERKRKKILCFPWGCGLHAIWIHPVVSCIVAPLVCTSIFFFVLHLLSWGENSHDVCILTHNYNGKYCNDMTFSQKVRDVRYFVFLLFCLIWSLRKKQSWKSQTRYCAWAMNPPPNLGRWSSLTALK